MNESAVLLAGDLAWPGCVLIIGLVVLITQRAALGRLIDRLKTLSYPGGSAELNIVAESGVAAISTLVESLPNSLGSAAAVNRQAPDGLLENREPIRDIEPLTVTRVTDLVTLSTRAVNLLDELAYPPPPGGLGHVQATIDVLRHRGVLDVAQADALRQLVENADEAAKGAQVPPRVAQAVQNSGSAILSQLDLLRAVAGPRSEDHVLDKLRQRLPDGWSMNTDLAIPRPGGDGAAHARVDALVSYAGRGVVVEVRARLRPGADGQVIAVRDWLGALPDDLPVLLVMFGDRLTGAELELLRAGRTGWVEVLLWDREEDALILTLRDLLERSGGVSPPLPSPRTPS